MAASSNSISLAQTPIVECINSHMDSRYWEDYKPRKGDIVVCTPYKTGTTWTQQIVETLLGWHKLVEEKDESSNIMLDCPWIDLAPGANTDPSKCPTPFLRDVKMPMIESLPSPRHLKTHLAANSLPYYPEVKYIYISRDGRDVALSLFNHFSNYNDNIREIFGSEMAPIEDFDVFYNLWIEKDGAPFWPFFSHVQGYFDQRDKKNVLLLHFSNLKADLQGEMKRVAKFLELEIPEPLWPELVHRCTFEYMKQNETQFEAPPIFMKSGVFMFKGRSRWVEVLDKDKLDAYNKKFQQMTPECQAYVEFGKLPMDVANP